MNGGSLVVRADGVLRMELKHHKGRGGSEIVRATIPTRLLVPDVARLERTNRRRLARGKAALPIPRLPDLESSGWSRRGESDVYERSWSVAFPSDRDQLRRDISWAISHLEWDGSRSGATLSSQHLGAVDEVFDVFGLLFLAVIGSVVGTAAGGITVLATGGLGDPLRVLLGLFLGIACGVGAAVVVSHPLIALAARVRWFRQHLDRVALAADLVVPGIAALLVTALVIGR